MTQPDATDDHARVVAALVSLIEDGLRLRDQTPASDAPLRLVPDPVAFAEELGAFSTFTAAVSAAERAAVAADYLPGSAAVGTRTGGRRAGRALSPGALVRTGVAGLLLAGGANPDLVANELAAYLAGPAISIWDYVLLNPDITLTAPIPMVAGWQMVTPTSDELRQLLPVPTAAAYQREQPFDLGTYGGLVMVRRVNTREKPIASRRIYFEPFRPLLGFWEPLIALCLYQNAVIHLWAHYIVEPGRAVGVRYRDVYTEPWTDDGEEFVDLPQQGAYRVRQDEPRFRSFIEHVSPLIERASAAGQGATKAMRAATERFHRVCEHFLAAGLEAYDEGQVYTETNEEATLRYVIALEGLLAGGDREGELARKVSQRAAMLAGEDDSTRIEVAANVKAAYEARSRFAHGDEPPDVDLPALRRIVRGCILARLILGDPPPDYRDLGALADAALLSTYALDEHIRKPLASFWAAVSDQ